MIAQNPLAWQWLIRDANVTQTAIPNNSAAFLVPHNPLVVGSSPARSTNVSAPFYKGAARVWFYTSLHFTRVKVFNIHDANVTGLDSLLTTDSAEIFSAKGQTLAARSEGPRE